MYICMYIYSYILERVTEPVFSRRHPFPVPTTRGVRLAKPPPSESKGFGCPFADTCLGLDPRDTTHDISHAP